VGTPAADVYAVGVIARELLGAPSPLDGVVDRALREQPEQRWADAREMLGAVHAALRARQAQ
jgi:hypothetical protein